jgi:Fic family protein
VKVPESPPSLAGILEAAGNDSEALRRLLIANNDPVDRKSRYLHWDDMRSRTPPDGLSRSEWWFTTAQARQSVSRELPLLSVDGDPFRFNNVDVVQEMVHRIDQKASGHILADDVVTSLRSSDRYLVSSLIEEAITSSQLEGASTTRRVAKEMLETGRKPQNYSEQMILNNFRAMIFAQELAGHSLTPEDVLSLHRTVSEETLNKPESVGRLQTPDDERVAVYWHDNTELHRPPPAAELPHRLGEMCRFASGDTPQGFIHPVVRAIILHFWLAYDHPFVDGNGRTARALFYWAMLHEGYWLTQYLSVSSILHKAPVQYARSFLLTETDGYDITYFVIYQLNVIERAIQSLNDYLSRKMAENRQIEQLIHGSSRLNHRQLLIMQDALRDADEPFTIAAQSRRNRVTYQTARTDLLGLEALELLVRHQQGNKFVFRSPSDLSDRLRDLGAQ